MPEEKFSYSSHKAVMSTLAIIDVLTDTNYWSSETKFTDYNKTHQLRRDCVPAGAALGRKSAKTLAVCQPSASQKRASTLIQGKERKNDLTMYFFFFKAIS